RGVPEKGVEPEQERRAGQRQDEPVLCDLLHPGADTRCEGACPHEPEIAVGALLERLAKTLRAGAQFRSVRGRRARAAHPCRQFSGIVGVLATSPVIGTKRTGRIACSVTRPEASLRKTFSSWKKPPTGI